METALSTMVMMLQLLQHKAKKVIGEQQSSGEESKQTQ